MNSIREYCDSEDCALTGLFLFTGAIQIFYYNALIQSRDSYLTQYVIEPAEPHGAL